MGEGVGRGGGAVQLNTPPLSMCVDHVPVTEKGIPKKKKKKGGGGGGGGGNDQQTN